MADHAERTAHDWHLYAVTDESVTEWYLARDFADAQQQWRRRATEDDADEDFQPETIQHVAEPGELVLDALLAALPAPPQEAPPEAATFNPCACGHEFVVHPFNRCIIRDCTCRQFTPAEPPPKAPSLPSFEEVMAEEAPPEPPRGTTYQLAPGELSGGPPYPTPGVATPEEQGAAGEERGERYRLIRQKPGDEHGYQFGVEDWAGEEPDRVILVGGRTHLEAKRRAERIAAALNGEELWEREAARLRKDLGRLRGELAAARQEEAESCPAAHVVGKKREGGGRDEPLHYYLVGPRRETEAEALADLARWEALEGQQEGEPVAWRWHGKNSPASAWLMGSSVPPYAESGEYVVEPLYAAPSPAAPPADERLREAAKRAVATCGFGTGYQGGSVPVELQAMLDLRAALDAAPPGGAVGAEDLLRRCEFVYDSQDGEKYCPLCENREDAGHEESCVLGQFIAARPAVAAPPAVEPPTVRGNAERLLAMSRHHIERCESAPPAVEMEGPAEGSVAQRLTEAFAAALTCIQEVTVLRQDANGFYAPGLLDGAGWDAVERTVLEAMGLAASLPDDFAPVAPPAMSEEVRELMAAAEEAQTYLCRRCCDEDATRIEVRLSDARRKVVAALDRAGQPPPAPPDGVAQIAAERRRQVEAEGWTPEHDDEMHPTGDLARAAACYAIPPESRDLIGEDVEMAHPPDDWPWGEKWWKPSPGDRVRELRKAGALIAAEIDRLLRLDRKAGQEEGGEVQR